MTSQVNPYLEIIAIIMALIASYLIFFRVGHR